MICSVAKHLAASPSHPAEVVMLAYLQLGNAIAVDPSLEEEAAMEGSATIIVHPHKETSYVCAVHKAGGVGLTTNQFQR